MPPRCWPRALGRGLIVAHDALAAAVEERELVQELEDGALVLGGAPDGVCVRHTVRPPGFGERAAAWRELTGLDDVTDVAAKFRLSIAQIEDAARLARALGGDLDAGAREASSGGARSRRG